ncbi:hypothetical protein [Amycolatopsis sp. cmx-4-61]|uniref:hypothetical protein n=1 Tax=Amycolatopsis sp. cmx-4-61 TaxID=2790937 RepID=UPI00397D8C24
MTNDRGSREVRRLNEPFIPTAAHCVPDVPGPHVDRSRIAALMGKYSTRATASGTPEGAEADVDRLRLDAVAVALRGGGSLDAGRDRTFMTGLVTEFPRLPQLAITAAGWSRDAAQEMLDRGIRAFLALGIDNGELLTTAGLSALSILSAAGAQVVVIEHDQDTHGIRDFGGHPMVAQLLASGEPVGILATAVLRPRDHDLAAILALLDAAPPASLLALTQITTNDHDDSPERAWLAMYFEQAGIPISVERHCVVEEMLCQRMRLGVGSADTEDQPTRNCDEMTSGLTTALLASHHWGNRAPGSLVGSESEPQYPGHTGTSARPLSVAAFIRHCIGLLLAGLVGLYLCRFSRAFADVRCQFQASTGWCSPASLHLAQFLPAYATGAALLIGGTVGARRVRTSRNVAPVVTLDWLILSTGVFVAVLLG